MLVYLVIFFHSSPKAGGGDGSPTIGRRRKVKEIIVFIAQGKELFIAVTLVTEPSDLKGF